MCQRSSNTSVAISRPYAHHTRSNRSRYFARKSSAGLPIRHRLSSVARAFSVLNPVRPTLLNDVLSGDMACPSTSTATDALITVGRQENSLVSSGVFFEKSRKKQLIGINQGFPTNFSVKMGEAVASSNHSEPIVEIDLTLDDIVDEETRPLLHQVTKLNLVFWFSPLINFLLIC